MGRMTVGPIRSVGILIAMREELAAFTRLWSLDWTGPGDFLTGRYRSLRIQVALSGAGLERATMATEHLTRAGQPDLLLNVGLSAGLKPGQQVGDLVLANQTQNAEHELCQVHQDWLARARQSVGCTTGGLLSAPLVLSRAAEKSRMSCACPQALALDMESFAFAKVAERQGLPWLSLRAISDTVEESLPLDFNRFFDASGQVSRAKLIKALAMRPQTVVQLLKFSAKVSTAQSALTRGVGRLMGDLAW
jgi:adenosylhomocysteine nucleosidase